MKGHLLAGDVAHLLGMTPAGVRQAAAAGRLRVAETTPKGVRLFTRGDAEAFRAAREAAQRDRHRGAAAENDEDCPRPAARPSGSSTATTPEAGGAPEPDLGASREATSAPPTGERAERGCDTDD
jgi:hypothetical protein